MRWWVAVVVFAVGSAIVGAEGPPAGKRNWVEQYDLYQRNKELVRELVDRSLELTTQADPLQRVETANWVARLLAKEIQEAAGRGEDDANRVVELGGHLRAVVRDGIIPNISQARAVIQPGSDGEKRLFRGRDATLDVIGSLEGVIAGDAPLAQLREVRETLQGIQGTRELIVKAVK